MLVKKGCTFAVSQSASILTSLITKDVFTSACLIDSLDTFCFRIKAITEDITAILPPPLKNNLYSGQCLC